MDPKKIALLVGALVVAAIAAITAKNMFSAAPVPMAQAMTAPAVAAPTGPKVLVATRALPVGTITGPDSFRYQPWPKELIENAYFVEGAIDPTTLAGTVVRNAVTAGQPLTQGALVKAGDRGFLAAALGPGMRAVTVLVSTATGVAGFVFPGDRVDLVLTQAVGAGEGPQLKTSETFITNMRVLATDQRAFTEADDKGQSKAVQTTSVTLEVTPRMAEKIAVAQTIGTLSLSLRSIADNAADLDRAIAAGEVKVMPGVDAKLQAAAMISAAGRPTDANTTFVTGADVSRFQRRTVPAVTVVAPGGTGDGNAGGSVLRVVNPGPVVRVARGNSVTEVQLGNK